MKQSLYIKTLALIAIASCISMQAERKHANALLKAAGNPGSTAAEHAELAYLTLLHKLQLLLKNTKTLKI